MRILLSLILILASNTAGADYRKGTALAEEGKISEAIVEFQKGADAGDPEAQFALGTHFYFGDGVSQDYSQALVLFTQASRKGNAASDFFLGKMFDNGYGVAKDPVTAVKHFTKAAHKCISQAQTMLGSHYFEGNGVKQDKITGAAWLLVAVWLRDEEAGQYVTPVFDELSSKERSQAIGMQKRLIATHECAR